MSWSNIAFQDLQAAKKQFGEYSYHDKGASEVMDLRPIIDTLRELPINEVISELTALNQMEDTSILVMEIIMELQDWDELFEHPDMTELLEEHY